MKKKPGFYKQTDIDLMLQAVDFIEGHLQEEITVADIAESVSFSLYHFSRVFSRVTRHTPYDYLMRRRLCTAAEKLLVSDEKIIAIAFDYQFNAPETFSRAFRRVFHTSPRQLRKSGRLEPRLVMVKPDRPYLNTLNSGIKLTPVPESREAVTVVGVAGQVVSQEGVDSLWKLFAEELREIGLAGGERPYTGVRIYPASLGMPLTYLAGTVLEEGEAVPISFVQKEIPAGRYASFGLSQMNRALAFMRQYIYQTWWPKAGVGGLPGFEVENYLGDPSAQGARILQLPLDPV